MTSYQYAEIWDDSQGGFTCTESQLLDWFLAEARKAFPADRVSKIEVWGLLGGEPWNVYTNDESAGYDWHTLRGMVIRRLCSDGWEPFSRSDHCVAFRKRVGEG